MRDEGSDEMAADCNYEELLKLNDIRRSFATEKLSDEEVEAITSQRMDPRHNHLNALLDPQ
jgi:hypothetical protein